LAAPAPVVSAASVPISTPPLRHSRSGATNVLFLDFSGATITGTEWNTALSVTNNVAVTTYVAKPYDLDGDPTTFSDTEQANIIEIWERVSEHYSPFDVDVTTERPATFTRTTGHAVITSKTDANGVTMPSGATAGGIAFVGVFGDSNYTTTTSPVFVYFDNLGTTANIAEAASHELGHNMGLSHQGTNNPGPNTSSPAGVGSYYYGHGTGATSWGPIMGAPYGKNVTQWCKGDYYDADNTEDALAIIAARLNYRPVSAGSTVATTAVAPVSGSALTASGVILNSSDANIYAFTTGAGTINLNAATFVAPSGTTGDSADLKIELLDNTGTVVATADPPTTTSATLSFAATAGTYYVRLTGSSTGTPFSSTPTGYTSYGSAGQYTLTGTFVAAAPAIVGPTTASTGAGQLFSYQIMATDAGGSYTASGLPAGLSVDPNTGIISGRAMAVGTFPVTLGASNANGAGQGTLTLTVNNAAPVITAQTSALQSVALAAPVTLSVTALSPGGTATFQWWHNGIPISGATSANLTLTDTAFTDAGWYEVQVTNVIGTTTSAPIYLLVAPSTSAVVGWGGNGSGQITIPGGLTNVVSIAAGYSHAVALLADGTVVAWGNNASGQATVPAGLTGVVAIAAGKNHSLAVKSDGTVTGWGDNSFGQTTIPASLTGVVAVAAGTYHSLALKSDGSVVAWGNNGSGQTTIPVGLTNVVAIACGPSDSLALKSDGTVVAWGYDGNHETDVPAGLNTARALVAGTYTSMAVRADGTVAVWGFTPYASPLDSQTGIRLAAGGADHALALKTDGTVIGGGNNGSGQITIPGGLTHAYGIAAGNLFSLAVQDATAYVAPVITTPPANLTVSPGGTATFTMAASGTPGPSYQWRKAGVAIPGATASSLVLNNVSVSDTGSYDVVVANGGGVVTSSAVTLLLTQTISFPPLSNQTYPVSPLTLSATATSGLPVTFSVISGPAGVSGVNGTTLTISGTGAVTVQADQAGNGAYAAAPAVQQSFSIVAGFAAWQAANFNLPADAAVSGPNVVYGQDGLTNLVKYALGLAAKTNATTGLPVLTTDGTNWIYTFTKPTAVTDVTITVEVSANLTSWSSSGVSLAKTGGNGTTDTWQATYPLSGAPNAFFRLNVSLP
ncbi:MAG: immunoglobulin domain-containing protein, partial [Opitutales bacterium]